MHFQILKRSILFHLRNFSISSAWAKTTYSQFGEDVIVSEIFKNKPTGFFVDVGAYHPFAFSNTYMLSRRGWTGINIEPNPLQFPLFQKYRKKDINLNVAISSELGEVSFIAHGTFSGIDDNSYVHHEKFPNAQRVKVKTISLARCLAEHAPIGDNSIDFLSIDCEGHEIVILDSNDWTKFAPQVIAIEDHCQDTQTPLDAKMDSIGYNLIAKAYLTKIFHRR